VGKHEDGNQEPARDRSGKGKVLGLSFVVGGAYAVLGQFIGTALLPVVGPTYTASATLCSLGVVAMVLYIPGIHQKIAAVSGYGSILPFNGFACGIADAYERGYSDGGVKGALVAVWKMFSSLVLAPAAICMVFAAVGMLVDFPQVAAPESVPMPLTLIGSFLVTGTICLVFQAIADAGHFSVPTMLFSGFLIAGICTMFGLTQVLSAIAGYGFGITLIGASQAITVTSGILFSGGDPLRFFSVLGVFLILALSGIVCGAGNLHMQVSKQGKRVEVKPEPKES
jgi:hypothetical protein